MFDRRMFLTAALAAAPGLARAAAPRRSARDLDGYWSGASYTTLERPKELKSLVLTPAEAEAWEAPLRPLGGMAASKPGEVGQAESEFNERGAGLVRIKGEIRSSLIVDPPDGKLPWRPEFAAKMGIGKSSADPTDGPEQRPVTERCLISTLSAAPMIPGPDANVLQFVQAPGVLAIVCEKYHEVRVIPLDGAPRPAGTPPAWGGTSTGRWTGDTLVVETAGLRPGINPRGNFFYLTGATQVTEWFTRTGPGEILYAFEVRDPDIFTRPWRAELRLTPSGRIYEYACHEGNYGLPNILGGARYEERQAAKAALQLPVRRE